MSLKYKTKKTIFKFQIFKNYKLKKAKKSSLALREHLHEILCSHRCVDRCSWLDLRCCSSHSTTTYSESWPWHSTWYETWCRSGTCLFDPPPLVACSDLGWVVFMNQFKLVVVLIYWVYFMFKDQLYRMTQF